MTLYLTHAAALLVGIVIGWWLCSRLRRFRARLEEDINRGRIAW